MCKRHEALPQNNSQFPHAKVCPKRSSLRIRIFDGVHCKPMFLSSTINSSIIWTKSSTAWAYTNKAAHRMLAIFSPAPISTPWWFKWNFYLRTAASKAALTRTGLTTSPCFTSRSIEMKAHDKVFLAGADTRSKVMNNKRLAPPDPTAHRTKDHTQPGWIF